MTTEHMMADLDRLAGVIDEMASLAAAGELGLEQVPAMVEVIADLVALAKSLSADGAALRALLPSDQIVEDIEELGEMAAEMSFDYQAAPPGFASAGQAWRRVQAWLEGLEEQEP